jgi:hypothetical protein
LRDNGYGKLSSSKKEAEVSLPKTVAENWVSKQSFFVLILTNIYQFTNLTNFQLNQTTDRKNENNNGLHELNELKVCEVSQN